MSWVLEIGMMPLRLSWPTVGFSPTSPLHEAGDTTELSVSVPMTTAHKLAAPAAPEPELPAGAALQEVGHGQLVQGKTARMGCRRFAAKTTGPFRSLFHK